MGAVGALLVSALSDCVLKLLPIQEHGRTDFLPTGVFFKRETLRLKILCPKLRNWDFVSWRGFPVARGLKFNSVRLLSKGPFRFQL